MRNGAKMENKNRMNSDKILEMIFIYLTEISSLRSYDEIVLLLANMGRALTYADRCTLWVVSEDRKTIWTKVSMGMDAIELPIDSGIVGNSIMNGEKIIIDDVYKDERFNPAIDIKTGYKTKSMMVIPLYNYDYEIIGAFQVINNLSKEGIFEQQDMNYIILASTYVAETLVSAKLTQEIEDTQKEVVFTMGTIAESRSKETANHVKRVAEYSKILALKYGFTLEEAELLKNASPMHDIGKIAIPDCILNKAGRFNNEERQIMNTHAELGYHMIKNSQYPLLKAASIVAHQHHEQWDGKGYPNSIKGENIHIYGRITALADVFDALGSDRVYKKAWNDEKIFDYFEEEKGKHFDPKLIDIFFDNINEFLDVRKQFIDIYEAVNSKAGESLNSIKILGAHGTKSKGFGTSAFYLDSKNVIDAGNLLDPLIEASAEIENIYLTHSHLDHISDIAYILDNYFYERKKPLNILGLKETTNALKKHFFNDVIWPDFSKIRLNNSTEMMVKYTEIEYGVKYPIDSSSSIEAFETDHTVPSCGYIYTKNSSSILISADTYSLDRVIELIESREDIKAMVIECSFPSEYKSLALQSKHLTPKLLFDRLKMLKRDNIALYINHIKANFISRVIEEIEEYRGEWNPKVLKDGEIINF